MPRLGPALAVVALAFIAAAHVATAADETILSFSGGGNRAMLGTATALRSMWKGGATKLGEVSELAGLSGGSWGVFSFALRPNDLMNNGRIAKETVNKSPPTLWSDFRFNGHQGVTAQQSFVYKLWRASINEEAFRSPSGDQTLTATELDQVQAKFRLGSKTPFNNPNLKVSAFYSDGGMRSEQIANWLLNKLKAKRFKKLVYSMKNPQRTCKVALYAGMPQRGKSECWRNDAPEGQAQASPTFRRERFTMDGRRMRIISSNHVEFAKDAAGSDVFSLGDLLTWSSSAFVAFAHPFTVRIAGGPGSPEQKVQVSDAGLDCNLPLDPSWFRPVASGDTRRIVFFDFSDSAPGAQMLPRGAKGASGRCRVKWENRFNIRLTEVKISSRDVQAVSDPSRFWLNTKVEERAVRKFTVQRTPTDPTDTAHAPTNINGVEVYYVWFRNVDDASELIVHQPTINMKLKAHKNDGGVGKNILKEAASARAYDKEHFDEIAAKTPLTYRSFLDKLVVPVLMKEGAI